MGEKRLGAGVFFQFAKKKERTLINLCVYWKGIHTRFWTDVKDQDQGQWEFQCIYRYLIIKKKPLKLVSKMVSPCLFLRDLKRPFMSKMFKAKKKKKE